MSDTTNPGLVNVADQAFKPDLKVDSLAIPLDDDVLVPVADQDIDPVTGNPLSVTFPTPAEVIVGDQAPGMPSQDFGEVPGVAPQYLPFPPNKNDPDVQRQNLTAGTIAEITVGQDVSIQTNFTPDMAKDYTVTAVADADTSTSPVVVFVPATGNFASASASSQGAGFATLTSTSVLPAALQNSQQVTITGAYAGTYAVSKRTTYSFDINAAFGGTSTGTWAVSQPLGGTFTSVQNTGSGIATMVSPTALSGLANGTTVTIAGSSPSPYDGVTTATNIISQAGGPFGFAAPSAIHAGKTTLAFAAALPAAMSTAKWMTIAGGTPYDGVRAIIPGSIVALGGVPLNVSAVVQENGSLTVSTVVSPSTVSLANGQPALLSGTGSYDGYWTVSNVVNLGPGSISSIVNSTPGVSATVNLVGTVPAGLAAGQNIVLAGTPDYDGLAVVLSAVTGASSFVIVWTNGASPTDNAGTWAAHTFDIGTPYTIPGTAGQWSCFAIDIDMASAGTASGIWSAFTFDISFGGTYAPAAGTWTANAPYVQPTTRYKLYVTPSDLISFGISMLGRQITFDQDSENPGAVRNITGYASNWIVIDQENPADAYIPVLQTPQPGDTFTLDVQRQGSEVITSGTGIVQDVTLLPIPAAAPPPVPFTADVFPQGQAIVAVSTGPQPGQPIITSGVPAPTAINVNVADQPPIGVGLPPNVFP